MLVLVMVLSVSVGTGIFVANAGVSKLTVCDPDDLSGQTALSRSVWYVNKSDNSGTSVSKGVISFVAPKKDSRFNLKTKIEDVSDCGVEENFVLDAKVKIEELPEGVKFYFAFGMPKMTSAPTEGGVALYLEKKSGSVNFGLTVYGASATSEAVASTEIGGYEDGNYFDLKLSVMADGSATGSVGSSAFTVTDMPTSGFAGFGQMTDGAGRAKIKLDGLGLTAYSNETPENSNFFEDFDQGCFNMNAFSSVSKASGAKVSKLSIENGQMNFVNTGSAFFASAFKYSNVDIGFDVTDIVRETGVDEEGNLKIQSSSFGLVFGMDLNNQMERKGKLSVEFVPERGLETVTSVVVKSDRDVLARTVLPEKYNMFANESVYSVKISVNDGSLKVCLKNASEIGFTEIIDYEIGYTPLGYFEIAALGAMDAMFQKNIATEQFAVGSFSIDNLSVVNQDYGKMLKLIDYTSNRESIPEDYVYVNEWDDGDLLQSTIQ